MKKELPVFLLWFEHLKWTLAMTEKFPKRVRFTLTQRLENLSLDILQDIVSAKYARDKRSILERINLNLEQLRVLSRVCFETQLINSKKYEYSSRQINEAGKMVGAWLKSCEKVQ